MADFACIARGMLLEDEYLDLDPDHMHVWLTLCISPIGGRPGIFKGGVNEMVTRTKRTAEVVRAAFAAFEYLGWLVKDGDWCWVRSRIAHHGHNAAWRDGALNDCRKLLASAGPSRLAQSCIEKYGGGEPAVNPRPARASNHTSSQNRKEQKETPAAVAAPPASAGAHLQAKPKPHDKPLTDAQQKCVPAAEKAIEAITGHCKERGIKAPTGATVKDAAIAFDELYRNESIAPRDALPALLWLLKDDFWHDKLLSPKQWRDRRRAGDPVKFAKAYLHWQDERNTTPGFSPPPAQPSDSAARQRLIDEQREEDEVWSRRLQELGHAGYCPPEGMDKDALKRWIADTERERLDKLAPPEAA